MEEERKKRNNEVRGKEKVAKNERKKTWSPVSPQRKKNKSDRLGFEALFSFLHHSKAR